MRSSAAPISACAASPSSTRPSGRSGRTASRRSAPATAPASPPRPGSRGNSPGSFILPRLAILWKSRSDTSMKRLLLTAVMVIVAAAAALASNYRNIGSTQAKTLLDKGTVFLLDVRTPQEYQQAHLAGAVLIPVSELERRI